MLKNYFKTAIRYFRRDKIYSLVNIFGLSIGMTAFILVAILLQYMYSYDKFNVNFNRIYRVQIEVQDEQKTESTYTVYPLGQELKNNYPDIEESTVISEIAGEYLSSRDDLVLKEQDGYLANNDILKVFTFNFLEGDQKNVLNNPGQIILTKTLARKLFPGEDALGKMLKGSFTGNLIVSGIIEDYPINSHIQISYIVSLSTMDKIFGRDYRGYKNNWKNNSYSTYLLLKNNAAPGQLESKIKNFLYTKVDGNNRKLYLKPLKDALWNATKYSVANSPIPYYAAIAVFILILSCINFINLTTARSSLREKEIGIRKVVGSSRFSLIKQFVSESVFISVPASILAFILASAYLPVFNYYMQAQLSISIKDNWQFILTMIGLLILVGMIASVYPAFYLSSLKPLTVIKGSAINSSSGKISKGVLRKILVSFQFITSISLILSTVFMFKQVDFLKNKDLGYNKSNLLRCYIEGIDTKSNFSEIRNKLLSNPNIIDATISVNTPLHGTGRRDVNWEGSNDEQKINTFFNTADYNFINTFQIKIIKGRNFSREFTTDSSACIINETFAARVGWQNPIGKKIYNNKYTVIGVVKDFHPISVHNRIPPYVLVLHNGYLRPENNFCIRISSADKTQSMQYVRNTLKYFYPDKIYDLQFYDTDFDRKTMQVWEGVQATFGFFSALAIIIALIGLLGLVSFSTRRRTKEIGVRKVLGASELGLYFLVVKEFLILLTAAIIIASPAANYVLKSAPGAYKYQTTAMDYIIPIVMIIVLTVLVTLKQVLKVTKINPSQSLHYE